MGYSQDGTELPTGQLVWSSFSGVVRNRLHRSEGRVIVYDEPEGI